MTTSVWRDASGNIRRSLIANLTGLAFAFPAFGQQAPAGGCDRFFGHEQMVSQTLYMHQEDVRHNLTVPLAYLEAAWDRVPGSEHQAQLFRVTFAGFEPVTRRQSSALMQEGNWNYFSFVLHDLVPLEELLDIKLYLSLPGLALGNDAFRRAPRNVFEEISHRDGLTHFMPPLDVEASRDVFVVRSDEGQVETILSCIPPGNALNPNCYHDFRANGIDIRAGYRREWLPRWADIQSNISGFVGCLIEQ